MRRLARFLIRLYPAPWRERYGEEFAALLEDGSFGWGAGFDVLKGAIKMRLDVPAFAKLALVLSVAGLVAGFGISFLVTPRYVSTARLTYHVPVPGRAVKLSEYLLQNETEILSRTSLKIVIQDALLDLYTEERVHTPLEDVILRMRQQDIRITQMTTPIPGGNSSQPFLAFEIRYSYRDRVKARQTVQVLVARFVEANWIHQRAEGSEANSVDLDVLDPPSLPLRSAYPNRMLFTAAGFGTGFVAAMLIGIFRRRLPPIPFPAQSA
jgi:hypothetical protein